MGASVYNIQARRATRPQDARSILANIADGTAQFDAQIHSLAFQTITEQRLAAAERNINLIRGMLAELRAHLPAPRGAA